VDNPILSQIPILPEDIEIVNENIFQLPSPHITPKHMLILQKRIYQAVQEGVYKGIVITHGTDTLEETAYFLDISVTARIPIVITGAMRSSNEVGSDGLYNFSNAIRVAAAEAAVNKGVLVVMNDEIHTARYVTKTHTTNVATFRTPTHGPIGVTTKHEIRFFHQLNDYVKHHVESLDGSIPIVKAYAGMTGEIFDYLLQKEISGLVIEGLGAGNLPPEASIGLDRILEAGIPCVLVSRCFNGIAEPVYAYEGGGVQLEQKGVIFANGINSQKARLKLLVGLNANLESEALTRFFHDA
jgi:L-asparaginase